MSKEYESSSDESSLEGYDSKETEYNNDEYEKNMPKLLMREDSDSSSNESEYEIAPVK